MNTPIPVQTSVPVVSPFSVQATFEFISTTMSIMIMISLGIFLFSQFKKVQRGEEVSSPFGVGGWLRD